MIKEKLRPLREPSSCQHPTKPSTRNACAWDSACAECSVCDQWRAKGVLARAETLYRGERMRVIGAGLHRMLDFVTVVGFALAPTVLGLVGFAATLSYLLAAVHLVLTLL